MQCFADRVKYALLLQDLSASAYLLRTRDCALYLFCASKLIVCIHLLIACCWRAARRGPGGSHDVMNCLASCLLSTRYRIAATPQICDIFVGAILPIDTHVNPTRSLFARPDSLDDSDSPRSLRLTKRSTATSLNYLRVHNGLPQIAQRCGTNRLSALGRHVCSLCRIFTAQ